MNDLISLGRGCQYHTPVCIISSCLKSQSFLSCFRNFALSPLSPPQESADGESGSGHEHHPQHLQPDPQVSGPADRTAVGQPAGGGGAPKLHCNAAVVQHLQVLLSLPFQR